MIRDQPAAEPVVDAHTQHRWRIIRLPLAVECDQPETLVEHGLEMGQRWKRRANDDCPHAAGPQLRDISLLPYRIALAVAEQHLETVLQGLSLHRPGKAAPEWVRHRWDDQPDKWSP